jgi:hypothetical protein
MFVRSSKNTNRVLQFSELISGAANGEDGEDPVVEVPPPMQPISSLPVAAAASSTSVDQKVSCGLSLVSLMGR